VSPLERDPLWYKDAVVYEVYVRSFYDSNGDGIGDFRGLTEKLDYLSQLGVNCIWLLPFYPSPMRDGGYDISDYTSIHPAFGTMRDFRRFIDEAHDRGIRVITELVINHTSDQHPWFQRARRAPRGSAARDMYVWSDTDTKYAGTRIIFTDTEVSNWTWDPVAGQYFWHRFFSHQPDLNFDNPRVRRAVKDFIKFWLDRGVDGLRLDAVPYLVEREGTNNENLPETHEVLKELRAFVDEHFEDRMLLAEANQWPTDVRAYFGDGDECHMAFHFPIMPRMFMGLRQEDRLPLVDILRLTPDIPEDCQWALFLRNHDELTLEMVTDEERDYMYTVYATDARMRVNVGIRRRLAPLLGDSRRAIELLSSLLFSLPGTPIIYYGDELGMGDNVFLGDRDGVRTPMQWTGDRNAGFSTTDPARLYLPVVMDPLYGYQAVNVEAQERSPSSLLNWMRRMIALRRERKVFGRGSMEMLHPENRSVLAFVRRYRDEVVLVIANLSRFVQPVELDLTEFAGATPVEMVGRNAFPRISEAPYFISLGPHTFFWFDLERRAEPLVAVTSPVETQGREPAVHISVAAGWQTLFEGEALTQLETEMLPRFLPAQRWFGGKERRIRGVRLLDALRLIEGVSPAWMVLLEVTYTGRPTVTETYNLPLAIATGRAASRIATATPESIVAYVEGAPGRGVLYDATHSEAATLAIVEAIGSGRSVRGSGGTLRPQPTGAYRELNDALEEHPAVERMSAEQSNTSVRIGGQLMLKVIRRTEPGVNPEIEVGRHLTRRRFARAPRLAGSVEYAPRDGSAATALVTLHEFVWSQADGWRFSLSELQRYLEHAAAWGEVPPPSTAGLLAPDPWDERGEAPMMESMYIDAAQVLGVRTAELHRALAEAGADAAFTPEPLAREDIELVAQRIEARLQKVTPALKRLLPDLDPEAAAAASAILEARGIRRRLARLARGTPDGLKIRVHGDYHLGQVLWVRQDFYITDFEGEVGLPIEVRRSKASPLTDVAGMLRSFEYAALFALREYAARMPDTEAVSARLKPWVQRWSVRAGTAFLDAYLEGVQEAGLLPADPLQQRRLLDLHLLDKALHELEYELGHRPDWVTVPLHGVAALLGGLE